MSFGMILTTAFETGLVLFTIWAVLHEEQIATAEQRLFAKIRRRKLRVVGSQPAKRSLS